MGERATIQIVIGKDYSPVIYLHWAGHRALDIIRQAAPQMRAGDIAYAFARLAGHCHNQTGGDSEMLSFGIWNAEGPVATDLTGDHGHFEIDMAQGTIRNNGRLIASQLRFGRG